MPYRGAEASDALEAPTAEGPLRFVLRPNGMELSVGTRGLQLAGRVATLVEQRPKKKQERRGSVRFDGRLVVARGFPREDLGIWIEHTDDEDPQLPASVARGGMQRIFGVTPLSTMSDEGLGALARLDAVVTRVRTAIGELAGDIRRGIEIGAGHVLDKVLLADHGDRYIVYARRLFRDRARFAMAVHRDGRIVVLDGKKPREITVTSRHGITVQGDYIRFCSHEGLDLARVAIPWIRPPDRDELARRIGQLVDRGDHEIPAI